MTGRFLITAERVMATVVWPMITFSMPFSIGKDGRVLALVREEPPPPHINIVIVPGWAQGLAKYPQTPNLKVQKLPKGQTVWNLEFGFDMLHPEANLEPFAAVIRIRTL